MKRKPDMSAIDLRWRFELEPDCRPTQFNRILETLKSCFPNCASMDLDELNRMTVWLEEEIFNDAISHSDYLYQVYLKILKLQTTTASHGMPSQVFNQGQSQISLRNQSRARQPQNVQNTIVNAGDQSSASLPTALPSMKSLTQTLVPNAAVQRINMQSGIAKNFVGSSVSQGLQSNIFSNTQRRPEWNQLQEFSSQKHQLLQHPLMKQNLLQPTQMSNVVGRSTNMQSEIAHAQQQQQLQHFSASMNSNAQTKDRIHVHGGTTGQNADDWEEEIYQKIQFMKQNYLPSLNEIHHKLSEECQQLMRNVSVLNAPQSERQKLLKLLTNHIFFLNMPKNSIVPTMKKLLAIYETQRTASVLNIPQCEKKNLSVESRKQILNVPNNIIVPFMKDMLSACEKQVIQLINSNWPRKPVSAQQQIQQPGAHRLSTQPQQQEEEVDNRPDAIHETIDVTGPKTADSSD